VLYLSGVMHKIPGVGFLKQPGSGNVVPAGMPWALDNGCFAGPFNHRRFMALVAPDALFCVLPDVVADWPATLERSMTWIEPVRGAGGRPAIVLQDGATPDAVPWGDVDAVFVGGSTRWKLGSAVPGLVAEAKRRGLWAHMGRVNSLRRLRLAKAIGCDSADGTFLAWAPDINAPRIARWLRSLEMQPMLPLREVQAA
jgi:hypothetical protein